MTNFAFLQTEWPDLYEAAAKAESLTFADARTSCFYCRRTLELAVHWMYKHDSSLKLPYQEHLSALIHEPTFRDLVGAAVFAKARVVKELGNLAVHSHKPVRQFDALTGVRELFHFCFWFARSYARTAKPMDGLVFDSNLPQTTPASAQTQEQLQGLEMQLSERDEKLKALLTDKAVLDQELKRLRSEVAEVKKANAATPDQHNYSEAETRDYFIDLLLKEAGWALDQKRDREYLVTGMPNNTGEGFVDDVMWGDDGIPLAINESKRTKRDPRVGQQQAKLYADCLEKQFGRRPIIFYSNGYEHWIWDDHFYPPRPVQGFYKKAELELLIQRRQTRKSLAEATVNQSIVDRYYQTRAVRRICEAFEKDHARKALDVMATGGGKTRMVIALSDVLMRCNWAKRVLFLCDRVALVRQAVNAFKKFLPESSPVNLVTEKEMEGRVFVSTYPTMMGLIDETKDGKKRFGPGHFDLVIIDEAHRSIYQKYAAIFQYFDSLLVGLTATPRDEVDRDTYRLFDLEKGVPTDAYDLKDAVADKFLVPSKSVSVPLKFQREGIKYKDLSEEEKDQWDALEWDEDGQTPEQVEAEAVNKWLFNEDTVDKVLAHVMLRGQKVAGGDRLGKTIIFAKNQDHADFIADRFNLNYPHYKGQFARVITFQTEYAQTLIDDFSVKDKAPHIAISVDMLDTGIDVPEVVNLVFFKLIRSKTKFWQMVGRGTRLCPDLFGPGKNKEFFYIFDYCQNLEYFSQDPEPTDGAVGESLGKKLFKTRLELINELDKKETEVLQDRAGKELELRRDVVAMLRTEVGSMNVDNFVVRPKRRLVEKYREAAAWQKLDLESMGELAREIAGLPTELDAEEEEAKRFDLLVLNLQLAVLRHEPAFQRLSEQVRAIAGLLEEKSSIPMIRDQIVLIQEVQTDEWWQDVTPGMLESVRRRLRSLIKLIEKKQRKPIYTDFEDELGKETSVNLPEFAGVDNFERFRDKARAFLHQHQTEFAIYKLRMNAPLMPGDLADLERILAESGVGSAADIERAKQESKGLGLFVRSLVGLDREAAKKAFAKFLAKKQFTANQIEFVDMIINYLTTYGAMDPDLLYESPFTDLAPKGPEGLFSVPEIDELIGTIHQIYETALA